MQASVHAKEEFFVRRERSEPQDLGRRPLYQPFVSLISFSHREASKNSPEPSQSYHEHNMYNPRDRASADRIQNQT